MSGSRGCKINKQRVLLSHFARAYVLLSFSMPDVDVLAAKTRYLGIGQSES